MAIQMHYCAACEKIKAHTLAAQITEKGGKKVEGHVCLECANSETAIINAFKKLSSAAKEKIIKYLLNKNIQYAGK